MMIFDEFDEHIREILLLGMFFLLFIIIIITLSFRIGLIVSRLCLIDIMIV